MLIQIRTGRSDDYLNRDNNKITLNEYGEGANNNKITTTMTTKFIIISIHKDNKKRECLLTEADKPNTGDRCTDTPTNWISDSLRGKLCLNSKLSCRWCRNTI